HKSQHKQNRPFPEGRPVQPLPWFLHLRHPRSFEPCVDAAPAAASALVAILARSRLRIEAEAYREPTKRSALPQAVWRHSEEISERHLVTLSGHRMVRFRMFAVGDR